VPAASVRVGLAVTAGDRIASSVRVSGTHVTVELRNLTTGRSFRKTVRMAAPDTSSAEWIAEAPATSTPGGETILPLTDFGTVHFTSATASSSAGHTGTVTDSAWTATRIVLRSSGPGGGRGPFGPFASDALSTAEAIPGRLLAGGAAFEVAWRRVAGGPGSSLA
jgi:Peptidase A4 family